MREHNTSNICEKHTKITKHFYWSLITEDLFLFCYYWGRGWGNQDLEQIIRVGGSCLFQHNWTYRTRAHQVVSVETGRYRRLELLNQCCTKQTKHNKICNRVLKQNVSLDACMFPNTCAQTNWKFFIVFAWLLLLSPLLWILLAMKFYYTNNFMITRNPINVFINENWMLLPLPFLLSNKVGIVAVSFLLASIMAGLMICVHNWLTWVNFFEMFPLGLRGVEKWMGENQLTLAHVNLLWEPR